MLRMRNMLSCGELKGVRKLKDNLKGRRTLFIGRGHLMKKKREKPFQVTFVTPHAWPRFTNRQVIIVVGCDRLS